MASSRTRLTSVFGILAFIVAVPVRAQVAVPAASAAASVSSERQIARGVRLLQTVIPDNTPDGPLMVTAVEIDPKASKEVRVEAALGQDQVWGTDSSLGREKVSSIVGRHKAVAGINACFFPFTGVPIGMHIQNGEIVSEPGQARTMFWIDKGGASHFDVVTYKGTVKGAAGDTMALDGMNRPAPTDKELAKTPNKDSLLLYTPIFFPNTLPKPGRFEVAIKLDRKDWPLPSNRDVTGTVVGAHEGGGMKIEKGTVILSGGGPGADFLRRIAASDGARVTFSLGIQTADGQPFDIGQVREAVTGGPRLITGGQITVRNMEEGFNAAFSTTKHPRSAVGVKADGKILLVAVDGRQKGISRGISLTDLANLMSRMGCVDAVNMDGGGSTALSVSGLIVNSPSEGLERPDATMLLVYAPPLSKGDTTNIASVRLPESLQVGDTLRLPSPEAGGWLWATRGGIGYVTQSDNIFHATRPGHGLVAEVRPGSGVPPQGATITVTGELNGDKAGFQTNMKLASDSSDPNRATLSIHIANAEGDPLSNEGVALTVVGGKADPATVTTDSKGNAQTVIVWDGVTPAASRAITATSASGRFTATTMRPGQ